MSTEATERQLRIAAMRRSLAAEMRKQAMVQQLELLNEMEKQAILSTLSDAGGRFMNWVTGGENEKGQSIFKSQEGSRAHTINPVQIIRNFSTQLAADIARTSGKNLGQGTVQGAWEGVGQALGSLVGQGEWGKKNPGLAMGIAGSAAVGIPALAYALWNSGGRSQQPVPQGAQPQYNQPRNQPRRGYFG